MNASEGAPTFLVWSRVWSPFVPVAWRAEAWEALELPASFAADLDALSS